MAEQTQVKLKGDALLKEITAPYKKDNIPNFDAGDNVKVNVRIVEGDRSRIQTFEGLVIKKQGGDIEETFTVRKISYGIGVERTFPVHSPAIDSIEVLRRGKVRRAKLNYIRNLSAKDSRIKERRDARTIKQEEAEREARKEAKRAKKAAKKQDKK